MNLYWWGALSAACIALAILFARYYETKLSRELKAEADALQGDGPWPPPTKHSSTSL